MPIERLLQLAGPLRPHYERVDWAATPLGQLATWTPAIRQTLDLAMHTRFPVCLFWGRELRLAYNEAFVELIADKHPAALGARAEDVFPEAWDTIGPMMHSVLDGHGATWLQDASVPLFRNGRLEEAFFTFSYSPVRDEDGTIVAMMNIASETTRSVVDRRHLRLLNELRRRLSDLSDPAELATRALACLREDADDFPAVDVRRPGAPADDPRLPGAPSEPVPARGMCVEPGPHGPVAWLGLGPPRGDGDPPLLCVLMNPGLAPDDEAYLGFLRLIASSLTQALDRVTARQAERDLAIAERGLSEALQRSALTPPLQPDHLRLAVRYQPAAEQAQIGGDWYDSFMLPDGALAVAIGDIAGHDQEAAAAMAQVRNLLRGIAYTRGESPARILGALDQAMYGLAVNVFATAIYARVEQSPEEAEAGRRTLRWSNAGHPPPALLRPDGSAELLERAPNLLLGLGTGRRRDHTVTLEPGASVVFYTDGLVERRGAPLEAGFAWLLDTLRGQQDLTADALVERLTEGLAAPLEDDLAILVLHAHPQDRPVPPEAGPEVLPR